MHGLIPAQVVITEGPPRDLVSWAIRQATGSAYTHAFLVLGEHLVEAWFPRCRIYPLERRLEELELAGRDFTVLDLPGITAGERIRVARKAVSYVGRLYDVPAVLGYLCKGRFLQDGGSALFCSRLVTAAFYSGIGRPLFSPRHLRRHLPGGESHPRYPDLLAGYATPHELLYSRLQPVRPLGLVEAAEGLRHPWPQRT